MNHVPRPDPAESTATRAHGSKSGSHGRESWTRPRLSESVLLITCATATPRVPPSQEQLERQIEAAEAALRAVEHELADPGAWSGAEASARSTARHEEARRTVEELYERLEQVTG